MNRPEVSKDKACLVSGGVAKSMHSVRKVTTSFQDSTHTF